MRRPLGLYSTPAILVARALSALLEHDVLALAAEGYKGDWRRRFRAIVALRDDMWNVEEDMITASTESRMLYTWL